jgi:predicted CXXCH cytochrome family protein
MGLAPWAQKNCAQEIDTAIIGRPATQFTVLDQLADPAEKRDFLAFYRASRPALKHLLAEQFIRDHPQSWLLPQAYEAAGKASIELGEYSRAIAEGRFSLRLLPENPLLLVPLANVEAQQSDLPAAEQHAKDALEYLDQFARPTGISEHDWNSMLPKLKASAYFVLGRIYATRGLGTRDAARDSLLRNAAQSLGEAEGLNANDAEILYLHGVVESALRNAAPAASYFWAAAQNGSPFRDLALEQLHKVFASSRGGSETFEEFLKHIPRSPKAIPKTTQVSSGKARRDSDSSSYAGSEACKTCHRREFASWRKTGMARMLRPYSAENIMGDFAGGTEFRGESDMVRIRMGSDSRPFFDVLGEDGRWSRFHVDYTIGSKWQQGYATRLADGRLHVLPIEYNRLQKAWINYWSMIDLPGSERAKIKNFPKLLPSTNYQQNCATCHTSQLKAASAGMTAMEYASFREPGINCEMCHGPSERHVRQMRTGQMSAKRPLDAPVDFTKLSNREAVRICAQCHRQSAIREMGGGHELNYSTHASSFVLPTAIRPYGEFSRRALYKDGRFRETTFIVEAFTRSACYKKGNAQCASCHDPHPVNPEQNLTSLKFRDSPDQMCLQCHPQYGRAIEKHTHHAALSGASRCVSCHMPRIANSVMFKARSHQIDDIPTVDLTERFGQDDSPNACLICHAEKKVSWVRDKLAHW